MKGAVRWTLWLIWGFAFVASVWAQASSEASVGWLRVWPVDSTLAEVRVDSQRAAVGPRGVIPVSPGRHTFTFLRRLNLWPPMHTWRVDTTVAPGDTLTLRLPTVVVIRSRPQDVEIWLGRRLLGRTPFWLVVAPGMWGKRLRFVKPGYEQMEKVLDPHVGGVLAVTLVPLQQSAAVASRKEPRALRVGTITSASLTLLAGVAAVQLRNEANATYGRYLRAGSRREMVWLYNRTRRLDRYSATAYGIFEVGFVVSFYLFLRWQAAVQD